MTIEVKSLGLQCFEPQSFGELERLAERCVRSRMFGQISADAAVVAMLTAASLGLAPITGLRGIHVVQGKAVLSSDLLVAVVLRSGQCDLWRPLEVTAERCVIETRRKGHAEPITHTWTIEQARKARLTGKGTWEQFPAAMLRARASAELARMVYPDVLFGVYVEGEIDEDRPVEAPRPVILALPDDAQRLATASQEARALAAPQPEADDPAEALIADLRDSAEACTSVAGLASLWQAARADVAALDDRPAQERCWRVLASRAKALGETITALKAAIASQGVAE